MKVLDPYPILKTLISYRKIFKHQNNDSDIHFTISIDRITHRIDQIEYL